MTTVNLVPLYNDLLDYLVDKATPQEILAFKASPEAQAYAHDLLERQSEGQLSAEEQTHLEQMEQVERLMSVLKAKALKRTHHAT
ncbi:MAG: hypothetical protein JXA10_14600 [Anaerolineae bacterium]|nr:hypothetical protein [Anaerolineae bacterium]